eukprot:CAMPEP_0174912632 /NCGR_PEP_ID=MMETSP0167-20121228/79887_1 /TAXON_ID=38298 /ORGANISM="Rhodella maculata, Strain CCMP736" /LENGTH=62 /DNA_ID=CAMNT_0016157291 /DNA_START=626 /DNA_END=814 /DNA_ORIENTATION=-
MSFTDLKFAPTGSASMVSSTPPGCHREKAATAEAQRCLNLVFELASPYRFGSLAGSSGVATL